MVVASDDAAFGPDDAPVLLHLDVNKTVIHTDGILLRDTDDGLREGIGDLFWGLASEEGGWRWTGAQPSCVPCEDDVQDAREAGGSLKTYAKYVKDSVPDKTARKEALRAFKLAGDDETREEMLEVLRMTTEKMRLPPEHIGCEATAAAGISGSNHNVFPAMFHMAARLQRSGRRFAILFRSFGADHVKVQTEWNAFCEMRHPIFSRLLEDVGPMDGTVPGVPDRRMHGIHTAYSDADGPVLVLDSFTNGPEEAPWDAWARRKPKPEADTRDGRRFIREVLRAQTVEGIAAVQDWMREHLFRQRTAGIKDDWAWWTWNYEEASFGKLMTLIPGPPTQQLFLDDNIDINEPRIVDCRDVDGTHMSSARSTGGSSALCVKVNPIEAILDVDYFTNKLLRVSRAS